MLVQRQCAAAKPFTHTSALGSVFFPHEDQLDSLPILVDALGKKDGFEGYWYAVCGCRTVCWAALRLTNSTAWQ